MRTLNWRRSAAWMLTGALGAGITGCNLGPKPAPFAPAVATTESPLAKFTGAVSGGAKKAVAWATPTPAIPHTKDPTSLNTIHDKIGPEVHLSLGRIHEAKGNLTTAETQYRKALETSPQDLNALLAYAHLLDRQGKLTEAQAFYDRAVQVHPKSATAHNDLGMCHARSKRYDAAVASIRTAVSLDGARPLYRNNLAAVLVEMGRTDEALAELKSVHSPGVAHYNLAFLLQQKGQTQAAIQHFAAASQLEPQLTAAQQWLAKLTQPTNPLAPNDPPPQRQVQPVSNPAPNNPFNAPTNRPTDRYEEAAQAHNPNTVRTPQANSMPADAESAPLPGGYYR